MPENNNVVSIVSKIEERKRQNLKRVKLVWLFCPKCKTIEYSEDIRPHGRRHNVCGSIVWEDIQEIDLEEELSIAQYNLQCLKQWSELINIQMGNYTDYSKKLSSLAGLIGKEELEATEVDGDDINDLNVTASDTLGLLFTPMMFNPLQRFESRIDNNSEESDIDSNPSPDTNGD